MHDARSPQEANAAGVDRSHGRDRRPHEDARGRARQARRRPRHRTTETAQLASQLSKVLAELAELGAGREVSPLDELDQQRKKRMSEAGIPDTPRRQASKRR
jgi:hypothetical protein